MLIFLTILITVAVILFFAGLFAWALISTWRTHTGKPPAFSDAFLYVATTLASLVGGIVAVAFGLPPPSALKGSMDAVTILTNLYALVYVVFGLMAILTWVMKADVTPIVVKNLATTFLGLSIPIVAAFFHHSLREVLQQL